MWAILKSSKVESVGRLNWPYSKEVNVWWCGDDIHTVKRPEQMKIFLRVKRQTAEEDFCVFLGVKKLLGKRRQH